MGFKLFTLCLAFLAVTVSASSIYKSGPEKEKPTSQGSLINSVAKYTLKMNKNGTDYDENVEIDTEKETETFHVPKTSPNEEAGDIVYDFKQNLTMMRIPVTNSCFLSESTDDIPKPADLKRLLENKNGVVLARSQTEVKLKVVGTLYDRSHLSDKMVDLCAKLPIYLVTEGEVDTTNAVQPRNLKAPAKRTKREWIKKKVCSTGCRWACKKICNGWICRTVCRALCNVACNWVWVYVG